MRAAMTFALLLALAAGSAPAAAQDDPAQPPEQDPPAAKQEQPQDDEAPKKKDAAPKKKDAAPKKKDAAPKKKDAAPKKDEESSQDEAAPAELPKDYKGLMARWNELEKQLNDVADKYRQAFSSDERSKILEEEYLPLSKEADRVLPALEKAAIEQYSNAPGEADEDLTQLLLGFASRAVRQDDYERALEIGKMLREGGSEDPALHYVIGMSAYSTQDFDLAEEELKAGVEARILGPAEMSLVDEIPDMKKAWEAEQAIRAKEAEADDLPRVKLTTSEGDVVVELFENEAPQTVGNFVHLVKEGFYDGLTFHRVLGNFMAQGGCPEGTGTGGPGYSIYCELDGDDYRRHFRGSLSMAHAGKDTGGSQFFLTFRPTPSLDGRHTVFGRVVEGWDVLSKLQRRNPQRPGQPEPDKILRAEVLRDRGHEYKPTKVGEDPPQPEPDNDKPDNDK